ncbi:MAG: prepilin-type N-terminal cleavage/methylation domain-containing protein [bacterium]|jgi:type II secretion system protein G|nr:prepilin-type N-terminal cleavage/methylation domain-containing protein [bacterium]
MKQIRAFTLIELLIVVAIIGILAAIAVPNFMNAQVRAKYARCLSDMKACQTALETYAVDYSKFPPNALEADNGWGIPKILTTPIPYIATIPTDPFFNYKKDTDTDFYEAYVDPRGEGKYFYQEAHNEWAQNMMDPLGPKRWTYRMQGRGPDTDFSSKETGYAREVDWPYTYGYDPSNGTISDGNIAFPR